MDSDHKVLLGVVALIVLAMAVIGASTTIYAQQTNAKVVAMVAAGADPIKAACAVNAQASNIDCNIVGGR